MTYLLDKSAWVVGGRQPEAAVRLAELARTGSLGMCTMAALEVLYSVRNADEHRATLQRLTRFRWFELSDQRAALELHHALALRGWHRTSLPDVLIACIAAEHRLTVLHYDSDYERLAQVAGIEHEWVVERGTGHAPVS